MPIAASAFAISFILPALIVVAATEGGGWLWGPPLYAMVFTTALDKVFALNRANPDPMTDERSLFWHRAVTWAWVPIQFATMVWCLAMLGEGHLSTGEKIALFAGLGLATGGVGITYGHELIHQRNRWEKALGEALLCSAWYGHFATEHLFNHHIHVGTPKDPVTARYNESFWRFLPRAVFGGARSAWRIDAERERRRGRAPFGLRNPWWRRLALSLAATVVAGQLAGWSGVALYLFSCVVAISLLEAVDYVEHYGLTRKHLGGGSYEHVKPRHSWDAAHLVTNLILINLQRHSDHHARPARRYPLLQVHDEAEAPQLPHGYPTMVMFAMIPPLWFRRMNPRVRAWRRRHYPEIEDWAPYKTGATPLPA